MLKNLPLSSEGVCNIRTRIVSPANARENREEQRKRVSPKRERNEEKEKLVDLRDSRNKQLKRDSVFGPIT